eukprot:INCI16145.4.p1 GENE.INCI16145.4~~INCI16145.4.p1  ORF type:complete len:340 (+),score=50.00 INCI16145.4:137-1156(+)
MANNASNEQTGLPPQVHDADVSEGDRVAPLIRFSVEGRRRQRRHADIQEMANQDAYQAMGGKLDSSGCIPDDADRSCIESVWQINLPRRLLALSYLGVFKFRILLTSSPVDALFFDQHHPMITTGHLPHNDEEQFIVQRLRDEFPNWPLIQEQVRLQPNSHLAHALGAAATVICDALFYYVANGMVVVVEKQLTPEEVEAEQPLPDNIAGVAKPTTPYTNRLALDENAIPLASPAGLFRIMRIFRHLLGDPFTREMCCEGPGCRHYDLLLGFLACHEDTLRHLTEPLSAQQAWEFYRVGTPNENEPLPVRHLPGLQHVFCSKAWLSFSISMLLWIGIRK